MERSDLPDDRSQGYDGVADEFMRVRSASGRDLVRQWARSLPQGGSVIDVGCGSGEPLTAVLIEAGLAVLAIDASPRLVAAFRSRFPDTEIACETAEESRFFGRRFDAILSVGLLFLLPAGRQEQVLTRFADSLVSGGRILFSAPYQTGIWDDLLTGRPSVSLGFKAYQALIEAKGMALIETHTDEGGTHYYEAQKR